jgi:putative transposase
MSAKDNLIEYVKNQEEHHKKTTFEFEYLALLEENEITPNPKYLI